MYADRRYDVFLSYPWHDAKDWADDLYTALTDLGLSVFQDDKETSAEDVDEIPEAVMGALRGSRVVVALMSPSFADSPHCHRELLTALNLAYQLRSPRRIVPVTWRLTPQQVWPRRLRARKLLRREGSNPAETAQAIARIVHDIEAQDRRRLGDAPASPEPQWFPEPVPGVRAFYGRDRELWDLHDALQSDRVRGPVAVSVRGLGGQGKTATAEQYARWKSEDHPGGVFVLRLDGQCDTAALDGQLARIAQKLGLPDAAALAPQLQARAPYLWIVDDLPSNMDDGLLRAVCAPTPNGRTLITTRGSLAGSVATELTLQPLDARAGLALLTGLAPVTAARWRPSDDVVAAKAVVAELAGHALGLKLAAGLAAAENFAGYPALLAELRSHRSEVLELAARLRGEVPAGYAQPFSAVVLRAMDGVGQAGRRVLAAVSVLAAAPIPGDLLAATVGEDLEAGLDAVQRYGLVESSGADAYAAHAIVGRAGRVLCALSARRRAHHAAMAALAGVVLDEDRPAGDKRRYLPHVRAVAGGAADIAADLDQWHLLHETGRLHSHLGDTRAAVADFQSLYASCLASPDCDQLTMLRVTNGLGAALLEDGRYSEALSYQRQALDQLRVLRGPNDPDVLWAMNNIANTHGHLGDHERAKTMLADVYRSWRRLLGGSAPETLTALNNLVIAVGRSDRARARAVALRYARCAHQLWLRTGGPDAVGAMDALNSVGVQLMALKDADGAAQAFREVWERRRTVLGEHHPDTIGAHENLITADRRRA